MHCLMRTLRFLAGMVAIVAAGILVGWWNIRTTPNSRNAPPVSQRAEPEATASMETDSQVVTPAVSAPPGRSHTQARPVVASVPEQPLTNWEEQVEAILNTSSPERAKATALLGIFPRLPEAGQSEVAATIAPLVPDSEFASLGQYLTNATIAEPVLDVLLAGLLSRPDAIKLPWLLTVAQDETNPRAPDAVYLLQALLGQDNGKDWGQWAASVDRYLQTGPE